jgi:hypothetical protein
MYSSEAWLFLGQKTAQLGWLKRKFIIFTPIFNQSMHEHSLI